MIELTRVALQENNININNEPWENNYLPASRQEFLLDLQPQIGQYLQEMCNNIRQ
jgi:hypothetical protein